MCDMCAAWMAIHNLEGCTGKKQITSWQEVGLIQKGADSLVRPCTYLRHRFLAWVCYRWGLPAPDHG